MQDNIYFDKYFDKNSHALVTLAKLLTPSLRFFRHLQDFRPFRAWLFLDLRHSDFDLSMYMAICCLKGLFMAAKAGLSGMEKLGQYEACNI